MSSEPINIFSTAVDVQGVAKVLRSLSPEVKITGPDDDWETIEIEGSKSGLFKKSSKLVFIRDSEYYDGPEWPLQVRGMQGYFSNFPGINERLDVLKLISTFRFALATDFEPEIDIESEDDRLKYLFAVAKHLDGVIFQPSALRDATGRVLIGSDGCYDEEATMPDIDLSKIAFRLTEESFEEEDEEPDPPSPERIGNRALALCAVTARALLEQEDLSDASVEEHRQEIMEWISQSGFGDELEPDEWEVIQRRVGSLDQQDAVNSTWRLEGLVVLAWALNLVDLPPYDQLIDPRRLLSSIGFLNEKQTKALMVSPTVRPKSELNTLGEQMFALHWRLRDQSLRPQHMDFVKFAEESWFGPLDISNLKTKDNDLALGGYSINDAPQDLFRQTMSAIMERHIAINWLNGHCKIYSHTDCST